MGNQPRVSKVCTGWVLSGIKRVGRTSNFVITRTSNWLPTSAEVLSLTYPWLVAAVSYPLNVPKSNAQCQHGL